MLNFFMDCVFMYSHSTGKHRFVNTFITRKLVIIFMNRLNMFCEVTFSFSALIALFTFELNIFMNSFHMRFQINGSAAFVVAELAIIRNSTVLCCLMIF